MSRTPTPQQQFAIDSAKANNCVVINAIAGSGKTSVLTMIAEQLPVRSLYLAFNKITATEAASKFPKHVECRTVHSVAYAEFGVQMQHKLSRPKGRYVNVAGTGGEIAKYYKMSAIMDEEGKVAVSQSYLGKLVKTTVQRFEQSDLDCIDSSCLPWGDLKEIQEDHRIKSQKLGAEILEVAKQLWKDRTSLTSCVLATHDSYQKLWQLSNPQLPYDVLYLDENQDATMTTIAVAKAQKHCKIIVVGDIRQNIYSWRGSINGMEMFDGVLCNLSKSFRYGTAIANVAQNILENKVEVLGLETINSVVGDVDKSKPYTILFRTNAELISNAVMLINEGKKIRIETDVKDFIKLLESGLALYEGRMKDIKHDSIVPYATYAAMVEESKDGGELKRVARAIDNGIVTRMINTLNSYKNSDNPDIILTTAHKSKGLEFEQVILADDFASPYDKKTGEFKGLSVEETNLLYVAVTRAIKVLQLNSTAFAFVEHYGQP